MILEIPQEEAPLADAPRKTTEGTDGPEIELSTSRIAVGAFAHTEEEATQEMAKLRENPMGAVEEMRSGRNLHEEINVSEQREAVAGKITNLEEEIQRVKAGDEQLAHARGELGVPHEKSERLKQLEKAREELVEEQHQIELAGKYNETLESFSSLSEEEREHIAETGKRLDGTAVKDKHGKEIKSDVAKELAHIYKSGGRHVTWGQMSKLGKIADRILKDLVDIVKGVVIGKGIGHKGGAGEKQDFSNN